MPRKASAWRLTGRALLAGMAVILAAAVTSVAVVGWRLYQNSQPLDIAAISGSMPVRAADREVSARIDADAAVLARGAPWLTGTGRLVTDSCGLTTTNGEGLVYSRSAQQWQCARQVIQAFGFMGSIRTRSRTLAAELTGNGWDTFPLQSLVPGFYEQTTSQGVGQAEHGNPPPGPDNGSVGQFDLTIFWAQRPALLPDRSLSKPPMPSGSIDSLIQRAYAQYDEVVVFLYTDTYVEGTGPDASAATTPPSYQGRAPCAGGGTDC
jgi:hypothetical protein